MKQSIVDGWFHLIHRALYDRALHDDDDDVDNDHDQQNENGEETENV